MSGPMGGLNVVDPTDVKILLHDQLSGEVAEIPAESDDFETEFADLPNLAKNIGRVYEAYRKNEEVASFVDAVARHELIAEMYATWDAAKNE